jgi:hypothetical protein
VQGRGAIAALRRCAVAAVTRLVTLVDINDENSDARQMSVSARHAAELPDGAARSALG